MITETPHPPKGFKARAWLRGVRIERQRATQQQARLFGSSPARSNTGANGRGVGLGRGVRTVTTAGLVGVPG